MVRFLSRSPASSKGTRSPPDTMAISTGIRLGAKSGLSRTARLYLAIGKPNACPSNSATKNARCGKRSAVSRASIRDPHEVLLKPGLVSAPSRLSGVHGLRHRLPVVEDFVAGQTPVGAFGDVRFKEVTDQGHVARPGRTNGTQFVEHVLNVAGTNLVEPQMAQR